MMSAEAVALEAAKAINVLKRDIILTCDGKLIIWLYNRLPAIADKLNYHEMAREASTPF